VLGENDTLYEVKLFPALQKHIHSLTKNEVIVIVIMFFLLFVGSVFYFVQRLKQPSISAQNPTALVDREPTTSPTVTATPDVATQIEQSPTPTITIAEVSPTSTPLPTKTPTATPTVAPTAVRQPTPTPTKQQPQTASLPSQVLNLSNWKIQLPIGQAEKPTEIKQPALAAYKIDPWFTVHSSGGVRFRAPVNGVTTSGSNYPRSELREMTNNGTTNASWSSSSGKHTMILDQAITAVPQGKKHIVAGQIHDGSDDVIVIRLEDKKLFIDIGGTDGPTLDANYVLGRRFTVKFEVTGGQTKIYYNGSASPAYTMSNSYSQAYFKAGAYTQSNCTTERDRGGTCADSNYGEVVVYSLSVSHQ
jgi:hypothetical protein